VLASALVVSSVAVVDIELVASVLAADPEPLPLSRGSSNAGFGPRHPTTPSPHTQLRRPTTAGSL
jgi:hypothetical protein